MTDILVHKKRRSTKPCVNRLIMKLRATNLSSLANTMQPKNSVSWRQSSQWRATSHTKRANAQSCVRRGATPPKSCQRKCQVATELRVVPHNSLYNIPCPKPPVRDLLQIESVPCLGVEDRRTEDPTRLHDDKLKVNGKVAARSRDRHDFETEGSQLASKI